MFGWMRDTKDVVVVVHHQVFGGCSNVRVYLCDELLTSNRHLSGHIEKSISLT